MVQGLRREFSSATPRRGSRASLRISRATASRAQTRRRKPQSASVGSLRLEYTKAGDGALAMLVLHDDASGCRAARRALRRCRHPTAAPFCLWRRSARHAILVIAGGPLTLTPPPYGTVYRAA